MLLVSTEEEKERLLCWCLIVISNDGAVVVPESEVEQNVDCRMPAVWHK